MKILVCDVGGTAIKSAIVDDNNNLSDVRVSESSNTVEGRMQRLIALARDYGDFDLFAVASRGQINAGEGRLLFRYDKRLEPGHGAFDMLDYIENEIGRPTFILNDCNAAALGEAYLGAGVGHDDFICLTYGTGVGGAIIQGGRLYEGARGIAGEMGHIVTHAGGLLCGCGGHGCYEQYASVTALVKKSAEVMPGIKNARELLIKAESCDILRDIIAAWIREVVAGLHTLTYVFNPSLIVLGGGIMENEDIINKVREEFYKTVIPTFAEVKLLPARLGNGAGMIGAAIYARECISKNK